MLVLAMNSSSAKFSEPSEPVNLTFRMHLMFTLGSRPLAVSALCCLGHCDYKMN